MSADADRGGAEADGFLSRWARRKEQVRNGVAVSPQPPAAVAEPAASTSAAAAAVPASATTAPIESIQTPAAEPLPTLADVALLTRESSYARFVGAGVDEGVTNAAMKKLFSDPHFNVMDGLDTYIADYGQPDPIPLAMLRQMNQSKFLRLFDDDDEEAAKDDAVQQTASAATPEPVKPPDDDADLRLQQDDAAGRPGAHQSPGA